MIANKRRQRNRFFLFIPGPCARSKRRVRPRTPFGAVRIESINRIDQKGKVRPKAAALPTGQSRRASPVSLRGSTTRSAEGAGSARGIIDCMLPGSAPCTKVQLAKPESKVALSHPPRLGKASGSAAMPVRFLSTMSTILYNPQKAEIAVRARKEAEDKYFGSFLAAYDAQNDGVVPQ